MSCVHLETASGQSWGNPLPVAQQEQRWTPAEDPREGSLQHLVELLKPPGLLPQVRGHEPARARTALQSGASYGPSCWSQGHCCCALESSGACSCCSLHWPVVRTPRTCCSLPWLSPHRRALQRAAPEQLSQAQRPQHQGAQRSPGQQSGSVHRTPSHVPASQQSFVVTSLPTSSKGVSSV